MAMMKAARVVVEEAAIVHHYHEQRLLERGREGRNWCCRCGSIGAAAEMVRHKPEEVDLPIGAVLGVQCMCKFSLNSRVVLSRVSIVSDRKQV
jgi:hypothetical protein